MRKQRGKAEVHNEVDKSGGETLGQYDMVFAYGFSCASAGQLEARGLRAFSGPLDWVEGRSVESFDVAVEWVSNRCMPDFRYADLCVSPQEQRDFMNRIVVADRRTGFTFPHDFTELSELSYETVRTRYAKRAERLAHALDGAAGKRVLIVSSVRTPEVTMDHWKRLLDRFRKTWPEVCFELYALTFCAPGRTRIEGCGLTVDFTERDFQPEDDLVSPTVDWRGLDYVVNTSVDSVKLVEWKSEGRKKADCMIATEIPKWRRYCFSTSVSLKAKRVWFKTLKVAWARGYLRFDGLPTVSRWAVSRFVTTRNPFYLFLVSKEACCRYTTMAYSRTAVPETFLHLKDTQEYDAVFSLGARCGCAYYLRRNDLRLMSGPMDWIYGAETLDERVHAIETHFSEWFRPEALHTVNTLGRFNRVEDAVLGYGYLHDFPNDVPLEVSFPAVVKKYGRRQKRFYACMAAAKKPLFVWFSFSSVHTAQEIRDCHDRLVRFFGKSVDLLVIEEDKQMPEGQVRETDVGEHICYLRARIKESDGGEATMLGNWPRLFDAVFQRFCLCRSKRWEVRRHHFRIKVGSAFIHLLAGFVPNRRIRQKLRGQRKGW